MLGALANMQDRQKDAPPPVRTVVDFLRSKSGMKTRAGVLNGQRVDYFKGSAAIKAVLSPEFAKLKNVPKVADEGEAERMLHGILPFAFFLRVDRGESSSKEAPRPLQVNQMQTFEADMYYAWFYEGNQLFMKLAGLGMIALLLAGVMFPLWPMFLRRAVYYLSLGVLGLFGLLMVIAVIRLIFWVISIVVVPPGIWIFPNLFADVGIIESFIPLWAWDVPPPKVKAKKHKKKRDKRAAADETQTAAPAEAEASASGACAGTGEAQHVASQFDDLN